MKINLLNIIQLKRYEFFDKSTNNYKWLNRVIRRKIQILLINAYLNNSNEVLMLIDNNFTHILSSDLSYTHVKLSDEMIQSLKQGGEFIAIHNHPSLGNFSLNDIITFIDIINIQYLFVVTNDCKHIAAIRKVDNISGYTELKIINGIKKYMQIYKLNGYESAIEIIKHLCDKGYIDYMEK